MVNTTQKLIERDLNHIWHPCTQMKDFEHYPPFVVYEAKGCYLHTDKGPVIDAISSWWCKSLGHGYPSVLQAIQEQLNRFEHVIGANTTHGQIVELAEELTAISNKQHVFFASDGSSAVEIAMKLAIHAAALKGYTKRNRFAALKNGYHGETLATLCISDLGIYKEPFKNMQLPCHFIQSIPYVPNAEDPLWQDCGEAWEKTLQELEPMKDSLCAIVVEPIVQGAGGMHCYSADFLRRLASFAKEHDIFLIADEIMTGLGRTGEWLASDHANIEPDLICLSKGLTSGALPLSCVLIDHAIYELFYADYSTGKSFLHSHTYSGNALAVSAALATIKAMKDLNIPEKARAIGALMTEEFNKIAQQTGKLANVRSLGGWVAGDLLAHQKPRMGFQLAQEACRRGALLRPLGNTVYWLPPLNADVATIRKLAEITLNSIEAVYKNRDPGYP
ncbi:MULTISPECIES: adenosylmethionine--8-amino-7-oxononanoate transaminase [Legionella]|uniref:Adenosylmethionine-8-amino-7-oxononanoate aminotransferase n=1 Tax=Legionella septentrionalis TaxID=2498109 RepID=A0A433JKU8_9GAMM|nr:MULTISPECIES: adenosylmethionine--8-amino-7-oxononanoate transaminase [Legionella]MCP0914430.1 adenosylmethionine--8-amino-7-oxononanoate transaminase [Legionella sp. 27cVA30]RUQ89503.1 adenosylmethionine--8-amino-7-oxononanoate transaminase [Legionella septentrionalis]RUQ97343.1 adenosylmethionine--8-amino-7-oxononanoate transaminase [Legionella septentrionalis]RUR10516.1 adenosylmethionine--8-amino-7-oxononanoate transaminase [Legionella septentrionalis]